MQESLSVPERIAYPPLTDLEKRLLFFTSHPFMHNKQIQRIDQQLATLTDQKNIAQMFRRFIYDPGLRRAYKIDDEKWSKIKAADSQAADQDRQAGPLDILNRRSFLRLAKESILDPNKQNKKIGFVYFDVSNLRGSNNTGFGEVLLHKTAETLIEVVQDLSLKYVGIELHVGRVGGDEFAILAEGENISQELLEQIHTKAQDQLARIRAYYEEDSKGQKQIVARPAQFKDLKQDTYFLCNRPEEKMQALIKAIDTGQHPQKSDVKNIPNNQEGKKSQAKENELIAGFTIADKISARKEKPVKLNAPIQALLKKHPELKAQRDKLLELAKTRPHVAYGLLLNLKLYLTHPLFAQKILMLPDWLLHMSYPERVLEDSFVVRAYMPFLKNYNDTEGITKGNEIILKVKDYLTRLLKKDRIDLINEELMVGFEGGAFTVNIPKRLIPNDKIGFFLQKYGDLIGDLDINISDTINTPIPVFVQAAELKKDELNRTVKEGNLYNYIQKNLLEDGLERVEKIQFVRWLLSQFKKDESMGVAILDFYTSNKRREERLDEIRSWAEAIEELSEISPALLEMITKYEGGSHS